MTRILIVGASGRTGRHLVRLALSKGLGVTTLARIGLEGEAPGVAVARGDVLDPSSLDAAVRGQDAVLCTLGPGEGSPPALCSDGTRNLVAAMKAHDVSRLVAVTGAMIGHPTEGLGWLYRALRSMVPESALADRRLQELQITTSGLDWTIVRPPRLTDGEPRGAWRSGEAIHLGAMASIARADLADFMLRAAGDRSLVRRAVSIAY